MLDFIKTQFGGRTQVLWLTCPPISADVRGGLVVEGMEDTQGMRFNVLEGNLMVATTTASYGYDVLDLHNMMMHQVKLCYAIVHTAKHQYISSYYQVHRRQPDGIHWTQAAVRFQVNLILTHFCESRGLPYPGRFRGKLFGLRERTSDIDDNKDDHN